MCRGVGARALSNGINSAVFFCFFEALRATFAQKKQEVPPGHPSATMHVVYLANLRAYAVAVCDACGLFWHPCYYTCML